MQYFIQVRRADGTTYPTTVEADSLAEARRKAQTYTESGETVEDVTENTSQIGTGTGATTIPSNVFDGPTTLDQLYKDFERQRAMPQAGINQEFGATDRDDVTTPIRTTGNEARGAGFQPGAYQGPMAPVEGQTENVEEETATLLPEAKVDPLAGINLPKAGGPPDYKMLPKGFIEEDEFETSSTEGREYNSFNNYIDSFLSDNARMSGFALGLEKIAPGQGLGQSVLYRSGPIGEYFASLQPEAAATYMAEDITRNFNSENPKANKTFDKFVGEFLQGDTGNTLFEKQTKAFSSILDKYRSETENTELTDMREGIASNFSDNSKNTSNVITLVRGMATSMFGDNYMRYVSPDQNALYDSWSRDQANKLRQVQPDTKDFLDSEVIELGKTSNFKGKTSFLEYAATAYGVPTDKIKLDQFATSKMER